MCGYGYVCIYEVIYTNVLGVICCVGMENVYLRVSACVMGIHTVGILVYTCV